MFHPDRRHVTRDRIIATEVMKLELRYARLRVTSGEALRPGSIGRPVVTPTRR